ncbi:hypothetical protein BD779DRAFT_1472570 [Infundibulicybe gibba]|nr:hypothetical protein BD779DRAFT_1472570 [Infundibulicybe gibba]
MSSTMSSPEPSLNVVTSNQLRSTTDRIIHECPRIRILVIGKVGCNRLLLGVSLTHGQSGVGKSALISAAFNVDLANVLHDRAGFWSIEKEIIPPHNDRFVLHDWQGFAPGEVANFNVVRNFIQRRANMPDVKDQLHAIWFCLEIPTNGAVLEMGDLNFLNLPLGKVPVVVAFTKLDILVHKFENDLYHSSAYHGEAIDEESFNALVDNHVKLELDRTCIHPLRMATHHFSGPPQYLAVSTKVLSAHTLANLVKVTQDHIDERVYLVWALAQRVNADVKIDASIRIGRRKYWRGLASSLFFTDKPLKTRLDAIHEDIVVTWNFYDEEMYLLSDEFKSVMSHLVSELGDPLSLAAADAAGQSHTAALDLVSGLISGDPTAPIGVATTVSMTCAQWVHRYDVYRVAPHVLRCLMGYIIDLMIVMQSLFWMISPNGGNHENGLPAMRDLVQDALEAYGNSGDLARVHGRISESVARTTVLNLAHRDHVLDEIERLILENKFVPPDIHAEARG